MDKLRIENFGPIYSAELELRKYNIIIGPQGSGKSCILKIASFCKWLEKVFLSGEYNEIKKNLSDKEFLEIHFLQFYKLSDFVEIKENQYSKIFYSNDLDLNIWLDFNSKSKKWITINEGREDHTPKKVAYIPAERCVLSAINPTDNGFRKNPCLTKFVRDFENVKTRHTSKSKFDILGLNVSYFYDEKQKDSFLTIEKEGLQKNIHFENAASGFQSVTPICILMDYYLNSSMPLSLKSEQFFDVLKFLIDRDIVKDAKELKKAVDDEKVRLQYHPDCSIFLEEPEENIYPKTQYELVKWMVKTMSNGNDNSVFIATHSPYILTSFNNLMWADKTIKENRDNKDKVFEIMKNDKFVSADKVSAYMVSNGITEDIIEGGNQIAAEKIDEISNLLGYEFDQLIDLE